MSLERCKDYRRLNKLITAIPCDDIIYLLDGDSVWTYHPYKDGLMIHADMAPDCRGKRARESAQASFDWVFKNTHARTIYAAIPQQRRHACMMAVSAGMTFVGIREGFRMYEVHHAG